MHSFARSVARTVRTTVQSYGSSIGSLVLRSAALRSACNAAYEGLGPWYADLFNFAMDGSRVPCEFTWSCRFANQPFQFSVYPELQRSWVNARTWHWRGNRALRTLYECYLRSHRPGVFLDIGANDGTHTYPFAAHGFRCVCFEPQASCLSYIAKVCALNSFRAVRLEQFAVTGQDEGIGTLFVSSSSWYSSLRRDDVERFEASSPLRVNTISLDAYCARCDLVPSFIKIDVEGVEGDVLSGGRRVFQTHHPDTLIEIHVTVENVRSIWDYFHALGYRSVLVQHNCPRRFLLLTNAQQILDRMANSRVCDVFFSTDPKTLSVVADAC